MASYEDRAVEALRESDGEPESNRAWFVLARAAVWALLHIAYAIETKPVGEDR